MACSKYIQVTSPKLKELIASLSKEQRKMYDKAIEKAKQAPKLAKSHQMRL